MEQIVIKTNDCLLSCFSDTFNILDACIYDIRIYTQEGNLSIEVYLKLLYPQKTDLKLSFYGIKEYSFYWNENHTFYNVESFKLLKMNDLFYISFDPYEEDNIISSKDQDFILCKRIEGAFPHNILL